MHDDAPPARLPGAPESDALKLQTCVHLVHRGAPSRVAARFRYIEQKSRTSSGCNPQLACFWVRAAGPLRLESAIRRTFGVVCHVGWFVVYVCIADEVCRQLRMLRCK